MPELSVRIVEYASQHRRVTIGDMVTLTVTSRNTLKQHFRGLLGKGHLVMHDSGRGAWYCLTERDLYKTVPPAKSSVYGCVRPLDEGIKYADP
jgi:hypothetical protein